MGLEHVISKTIAGAAVVALAGACSHSAESVQETSKSVTGAVAPSIARVEVAIPPLLRLSVDELAQHLGPSRPMPASVHALLSQIPSADPTDSLRFFRYRHLNVLVSYNARTRRFDDLLLLGSNEDVLMQRAGLSADAGNYIVLPVFHARYHTQLEGLRVVPVDPTQLK